MRQNKIQRYKRQQYTMIAVLAISTAIVMLNIIAVTTGVADGYYAEISNWISTSH